MVRGLLRWGPGCDPNHQLVLGYRDHPKKKLPVTCTPLCSAAKHNYLETAETLLAHGADPNLIGKHGEYSPLQQAARHGSLDVLQLLLSIGAELQPDDLLCAIQSNSYRCGEALVEAGCDPCEPVDDNDGMTLAEMMSMPGYLEIDSPMFKDPDRVQGRVQLLHLVLAHHEYKAEHKVSACGKGLSEIQAVHRTALQHAEEALPSGSLLVPAGTAVEVGATYDSPDAPDLAGAHGIVVDFIEAQGHFSGKRPWMAALMFPGRTEPENNCKIRGS